MKTLEERFWEKVLITPFYECWEWLGSKDKDGYGYFGHKDKAHRFSWKINNGVIPHKIHVLHKCDNPSCVRPQHLFLGTHEDNMKDMAKKGRAKWGGKIPLMERQASCKRGHKFDPKNIYEYPSGRRSCRLCREINRATWRARHP